jgi:hypothetical protein
MAQVHEHEWTEWRGMEICESCGELATAPSEFDWPKKDRAKEFKEGLSR